MSNDISYLLTKEKNRECGRNGYHWARREKVKDISPVEYGEFLSRRKKKRKRR